MLTIWNWIKKSHFAFWIAEMKNLMYSYFKEDLIKKKSWLLWHIIGYGIGDVDLLMNSALQMGTIYQPLRSGRIWHKVNF